MLRRALALAALLAPAALVATAGPAGACSFAPFKVSASPAAVAPGQPARVRFDGPRGYSYELRAVEAAGASTVVASGVLPVPQGVLYTPRTRSTTRFELTYSSPPAPAPSPGAVVTVSSCDNVVLRVAGPTLVVRHDLDRLVAQRTGVRSYAFSGRVAPAHAGDLVSLYRVAGSRRVLTAQTRAGADGAYRVDRPFARSGVWTFYAEVRGDARNGLGRSAARPTVVH